MTGPSSPGASQAPEPSASPSPTAHISPDGRLPVAGPAGTVGLACPTGELLRRSAAPGEVQAVARRLLQAAGAPVPDPRTVWGLLDPSLRGPFPSFQAFARDMRSTPYDPTYDPGEAVVSYVGRGFAEHPRPAGATIPRLGEVLERLCGPAMLGEVARSYWYVLFVYPETVGDCAGCGLPLYFLTRPDGVRFWTSF